MRSSMNVRSFRKAINETKAGETVYINAINLSINSIEAIREYVKSGVLVPVREEVEKAYKDVDAVMSGKTVMPQMTYIKR